MSDCPVYILIPSRLESSRLPQKPLLDICGVPMILHVAFRANLCPGIASAIVCTDNARIAEICIKNGVKVCLTKSAHRNGTERIAEAAEIMGIPENSIVVDLQGDEPLVEPYVVSKVIELAKACFASGGEIFLPHSALRSSNNPNVVKVVASGPRVIYLSRADAPHSFSQDIGLKKHLSVICFTKKSLVKFGALPLGELEGVEGVELLRALECGMVVLTSEIESESFSVDTVPDLERARRVMADSTVYKDYISRVIT